MKITIKFVKYQNSSILKEKHFYWILFSFIMHHKKFFKCPRSLKVRLAIALQSQITSFHIYVYIYIYSFHIYIHTKVFTFVT